MNIMMGDEFNITGTWVNRINGDKITIRNTFIDGDNMIIQTTDGRQVSMIEFQNYIQMGDDEYDESGHIIGHANGGVSNIENIENERRVIVNGSRQTTNINNNAQMERTVIDKTIEPTEKKTRSTVNTVEKESDILLRKLFEKIELDIDVKVDLDCTNFPSKELNMLQTIYDVSTDDISAYILKHIINDEVIKSAVSRYIENQLM